MRDIDLMLIYLTSFVTFSILHFDLVNCFVKTYETDNGKITVNTTLLKKHKGVALSVWVPKLLPTLLDTTQEICTKTCMKTPSCFSFNYHFTNKQCDFHSTTLAYEHYKFIYHNSFAIFELENGCIRNHGVCEHGSECVPHLNNGSYYCRWCFEPFSGRHCNETVETGFLPKSLISQGILDGKNSSCKSLKKHFSAKSGVSVIHPWNDERSLTVFCSNAQMVVTRIHFPNPRYYGDLESGLDLSTADFHVSTTFLDKLYKLVKFRSMDISCKLTGAVGDGPQRKLSLLFKKPEHTNVLRYLLGHTDTLPDVTDDYSDNPEIVPNGIQDGKFSDTRAPFEERYSKKLIKFTNGDVLSFNGAYGCFSPLETYLNGEYDVLV